MEIKLNRFRSAILSFIFITAVISIFFYGSEYVFSQEAVILENDTIIQVNSDQIKAEISYSRDYKMHASWYGAEFGNRPTANGEIFDPNGFTAAHKTLPFGTVLMIENPSTGKSVIVRINDRGPYITGRDIDLSRAAAKQLGMIKPGVVEIKAKEIVLNNSIDPIASY